MKTAYLLAAFLVGAGSIEWFVNRDPLWLVIDLAMAAVTFFLLRWLVRNNVAEERRSTILAPPTSVEDSPTKGYVDGE